MSGSRPAGAAAHVDAWRPSLSALRLVGAGRSVAMLTPEAEVRWWCAPEFDDQPLCWRLLDPAGGAAGFPGLRHVDADDTPAGTSATTLLRDPTGVVEVKDALLPRGTGVVLVRLLRRRPGGSAAAAPVDHHLRLGGFETPEVGWTVTGGAASGVLRSRSRDRPVRVDGGTQRVQDGELVTRLDVAEDRWSTLLVAVGTDSGADPGTGTGTDAGTDADALLREVDRQDATEAGRVDHGWLPRLHPQRALDALAVVRACTSEASGAVVAAPTTSLPEAPGHDRQYDYRYTWLRDASLSTAVAALLGQSGDARRYLDFVHDAWGEQDLLTRPMLDVRGAPVPRERTVPGVRGWAGSRPVRVGNGATAQRQYDSLGLLVEAVSVFLQTGAELDDRTWDLVRRLADQVADEPADEVPDSNGIWEVRDPQPLVDGDVGRWLVLDRAVWIAAIWRPTARRARWRRARDTIRRRILAAVTEDGLLPQAYGQDPPVPDASALMAVAFGLLDRDDPRAGALVDQLLQRLGAGPFLYRYPPGRDDGFHGDEGAFLPVSFLAVTALARLGRVAEAEQRLDRLCAALPRLLAEEVDPVDGAMRGNTPLVWSHAELARAVYVLDAARRRERWTAAGLWVWRMQRYVRLRRSARATTTTTTSGTSTTSSTRRTTCA